MSGNLHRDPNAGAPLSTEEVRFTPANEVASERQDLPSQDASPLSTRGAAATDDAHHHDRDRDLSEGTGVDNFSMGLHSSFAYAVPAAVFVAAAEEREEQERQRQQREDMAERVAIDMNGKQRDGASDNAAEAVQVGDNSASYRELDMAVITTASEAAPLPSSGDDDDFLRDRTGADKKKKRKQNRQTQRPKKGAHAKPARPKATPLPKFQISILVLVMMTESVGAFMLLPFVGLYVSFLQGWSNEQSGLIAGVVVGCYMLGAFLSSKFWGNVSDKYGRRVPLVAGLWVCAVMMLLFGLSQNFAMACVVRFIQGLSNGCVLIARTVVAEITDSTNVAKAFSCISFSWGFGTVIGSVIGGYLYDPVRRMGADPNGFFGQYPAFLPGVVCSGYMFFTWAVSTAFLKETNVRRRALVDILPKRCADAVACRLPFVARSREAARARLAALEERQPQLNEREDGEGQRPTATAKEGIEGSGGGTTSKKAGPAATEAAAVEEEKGNEVGTNPASPLFSASEKKESAFTYADAFRIPRTRYITLMIGLWAAADMAYSECLPLWCIASREVGGLAVYSDMVSILTLAMGAPTILANLAFPWLCGKFNDKTWLFRCAVAVWVIFTCVIPAGGDMQKLGSSAGYWYVFAIGIPRQAALSVAYGVCWLLVPRVAPRGHVGETNGLVNAAASLMRCVVPFAAAPLFAWSISSTKHYFPYNHFFIFLLAALCGVSSFVLSFFLHITPDKPHQPREEEKGINNENEDDADEHGEGRADGLGGEPPSSTQPEEFNAADKHGGGDHTVAVCVSEEASASPAPVSGERATPPAKKWTDDEPAAFAH